VPLRVAGPLGLAILLVLCVAVGAWFPSWLPAVLFAIAGISLAILRADAVGGIVVGALLAALSATLGVSAVTTEAGGTSLTHDLRESGLPDDVEGFVTLTGHLRVEWMLDEYRVARGDRPDSARESATVLTPLLGTSEDVVKSQGRVVIARVDRTRAAKGGVVTLSGDLVPVADEVLETLFAVSARGETEAGGSEGAEGKAAVPPIRGVMLDTLVVPSPMRWIGNALASAILGVVGIFVLALVLSGEPPSTTANAKDLAVVEGSGRAGDQRTQRGAGGREDRARKGRDRA